MRERYGVRIHVDAAYGGFFRLLSGVDGPEGLPEAPWLAIAEADSIVIDPHKHVLMKPECEDYVDLLHERLEELSRSRSVCCGSGTEKLGLSELGPSDTGH